MIDVIGVRFNCVSKLYYFDPVGETYERGDRVIVETARGVEMGSVIAANRAVPDDEVTQPLKPVIRKATQEDLDNEIKNKAKEPEAFRICKEKIKAHELDMKLVASEYTFDGSKVLFYFTADGRVDFRELVKDLAVTFRTRIELRQIGVRDEAKLKGGIGVCGRSLCCNSYLCDFVPVSIKMAKEQNLSLNPTKISGCCGRLMCCLINEEETYEELNSTLPSIGDAVSVRGEGKKGTVSGVNVLRQKVRVLVDLGDDETDVVEYPVSELIFEKGRRTFPVRDDSEESEELRELEELDEKDEAALLTEEGGEHHSRRDKKDFRRGEDRVRRDRGRQRAENSGGDGSERRENSSDRRRDRDEKRDGDGQRHERGDRRGSDRRRQDRREKVEGERGKSSRSEQVGDRGTDNKRPEGGEHARRERRSHENIDRSNAGRIDESGEHRGRGENAERVRHDRPRRERAERNDGEGRERSENHENGESGQEHRSHRRPDRRREHEGSAAEGMTEHIEGDNVRRKRPYRGRGFRRKSDGTDREAGRTDNTSGES